MKGEISSTSSRPRQPPGFLIHVKPRFSGGSSYSSVHWQLSSLPSPPSAAERHRPSLSSSPSPPAPWAEAFRRRQRHRGFRLAKDPRHQHYRDLRRRRRGEHQQTGTGQGRFRHAQYAGPATGVGRQGPLQEAVSEHALFHVRPFTEQ